MRVCVKRNVLMNISRYKRVFCRVCIECVTVFSYEGPNYVQCLPSIEMEWLSLFFFLLPGNAFADCKRAREKWELRGGELIYLFFSSSSSVRTPIKTRIILVSTGPEKMR